MSGNTRNKYGGSPLGNSLRYKTSFTDNGKICTKCKKERPLSKFGRQGKNYKSWCKFCISEYSKAKNKKERQSLW